MNDEIIVRPIRPDDVERLQAMHRRLSPEAIRLRFHGYLKELSDVMARRFCTVDGWNRVAYVAVTDDPERIVAVGRYDRMDDGVAEVAFVVEDEYQGHGIGKRLLAQLMETAGRQGVTTFMARIVPGNSRMRKLLQQTGRPVTLTHDYDADELWLALDANQPADTSRFQSGCSLPGSA